MPGSPLPDGASGSARVDLAAGRMGTAEPVTRLKIIHKRQSDRYRWVMNGFPNQVANLEKIALGMRTLVRLVDDGDNAKDDGVFGEELVRAGVAGTGHRHMPVDQYINEQLTRQPSNQSFRTTARGLRELYRLLGFIDDSGLQVVVTPLGRQAATFAGQPFVTQIDFWRSTIRVMVHSTDQANASHPYQVLLRLVGQKPGIIRAKCALALEARDDSTEELARIAALADLTEEDIRHRIGASTSNWNNAKKILPSWAEQLRDVIVTRRKTYRLADAPGRAEAEPALTQGAPRAPRTSRPVTPETIARAGTAELHHDPEFEVPINVNPGAAAAANRLRLDRLRRHNLIVQTLAARLAPVGAQLYEDPFDILALIAAVGILVEVKTLDGTDTDERERVRDALGQLLYYEPFTAAPLAGQATIHKIACFETAISAAHRAWLNRSNIGVIWSVGNGLFAADALARGVLRRCLEELR